MPTIKELADEYGVSKSTMRRYIGKALPGIFNGNRLNLTEDQTHTLAHYIAEHESSSVNKNVLENGSRTLQRTDFEQVSESVSDKLRKLEIENASLKAMNASLERENQHLLERLEVADKALEREQNIKLGFWSRLGQKLLGEGKKKKD